MQKNKEKILVYMSGGVDSSVAAALLVNAGHDVTGAFMVDYDDPARPGSCWHGDYEDALRVCAKLGIKLLRLDFRKEYQKLVLNYMYKEYKAGRTPNPDVLCNKYIKFGVWMNKVSELGFDFVATGHYARVSLSSPRRRGSSFFCHSERSEESSPLSQSRSFLPAGRQALLLRMTRGCGNDNIKLSEAKDKNKDQTYFLHQLTQEQLRYVIFPLGEYTKPEVRKLAKKFNLPTADKEESMGICFIGEVPMKEFLQKKIKIKKGNIMLSPTLNEGEGGGGVSKVIGEHDGLAFYTIGQRMGVQPVIPAKAGIFSRCHSELVSESKLFKTKILNRVQDDNVRPLFVVGKNTKNNELVVGYEDDPLLHKKEIQVGELNWISGHPPKFPLKCKVRLRHRQELQDCMIVHSQQPIANRKVEIKFAKPQRAPTPGQFAVFYLRGECLGGGVIK